MHDKTFQTIHYDTDLNVLVNAIFFTDEITGQSSTLRLSEVF
jgi:hypothetical protein